MSEVIILDTHIWIWLVNRNFDRFPSEWVDRLQSARQIGVSPVSCYEIALAQEKGRLRLHCPAQEWFQGALEPLGIEIFPLTPKITTQAVQLSPIHIRSV
jgi:PIN domain nuclease of toxin-antitoxin system